MSQYQTIKTQAGMGLEAAADTGGPPIKLIAMSVGDGNGNAVSVSTTQTGLVHEVDRVSLNRLQQNQNDATQWVAEAVFPADHGGYTVREVGLWTDGGVLFAVASFPETYKPAPSEGTAGQLIIELNFRASNSDNVTLVVDGALQLATQDWVKSGFMPAKNPTINGQPLVTAEDLAAERKRAEEAEGKLQPAGDYATNAALNTETQRAQAAENELLSGTQGVSSSAGDLRGLGLFWQAVSDAPCFIRRAADGSTVFTALVTRSQVDSWLSGYATNAALSGYATTSALSAETQRAEAAENELLSGTQGVASSAGDLRGLGLFWQAVSDAPCFIRENADGSQTFTALVTRSQVDSWLSGYATNAALNAETNRAEAAENARVAKSGDTMGGSLIFDSGNQFSTWAATPQMICRIGGGIFSVWGQAFGDRMVGLIGGNNPGQPYRNWRLDPTAGTVTTPSGNCLLETSNTRGVRLKQAFRVSVANGAVISWPIVYSNDDEVFVTFTPTDNGNGQVHIVNILVGTTPNRSNCTVAVATWNKSNSGNMKPDPDPVTIDVIVEGYA